ncbi:hypothetical protein CON36_33080 [Bacillus cereus]|uniref:Uncharacterized protein n=1 Tax=Bacillus cereus TaxID=1396 RepID=A0A9X6ST05_BACCE|nr:hypothetical protein [Bacillus cereus]PDZ94582.1 hypothetical protein CON36_33080 [Bacillus cereus]
MQSLLLKVPDGIVKGFDDDEELESYVISNGLEEEGYDIYEVKEVLQKIEDSELDDEDKNALLKKLKKEDFEFEINDYPDLYDVLENCNSRVF